MRAATGLVRAMPVSCAPCPFRHFVLFLTLTVIRGVELLTTEGPCPRAFRPRMRLPDQRPCSSPPSTFSPIFQRRIPLKGTLGRFEASAAVALAVWSALRILPAAGETLSQTPAGLQASDSVRCVGISSAVGSEWIPNGARLATILDSSARALGKGTLLALVEHHGDGAATAFDMVWTVATTEGRAADPGRIGGGAGVQSRSSSANAPWTPSRGAETSASTRSPLSGVSR